MECTRGNRYHPQVLIELPRAAIDCTNPSNALDEWRNNLVGYETEFWDTPSYSVSRSEQSPELFAIEIGNTVVLNMNVVRAPDEGGDRAFSRLLRENLRWIDTIYERSTENQRNFILLSNQGVPEDDDQRFEFYGNLLEALANYDQVQFYWIQAGNEGNLDVQSEFNGIENLDVISVTNQAWPLLRVAVNTSETATGPITLGYDRSSE